MSENKRNQLNSIGFVWRLTAADRISNDKLAPTVEDPKKKKLKLNEEAAQGDTVFGQQAWDSYFEQLCEFVRNIQALQRPMHSIQSWDDGQRSSDNCTSGSK